MTSATAALTVVSNALPTVNVTSPANGDVLTPAPLNTKIWVNAWSPGAITTIAYYLGTTKLGQTDGTISNIDWLNVAAGTYSLTAKVTDNQGQTTTSAPVTVTVKPAVNFSNWASDNALSGAAALDTASPAKDGISNLMKYALGLNPNQVCARVTDGVTAGMPLVAVEGSNLTLLYQQDTTKTDLTYAVESSTDLAGWNTRGVTETLQSTTGDIELRKAAVPMGTDKKKFIRLKVGR